MQVGGSLFLAMAQGSLCMASSQFCISTLKFLEIVFSWLFGAPFTCCSFRNVDTEMCNLSLGYHELKLLSEHSKSRSIS